MGQFWYVLGLWLGRHYAACLLCGSVSPAIGSDTLGPRQTPATPSCPLCFGLRHVPAQHQFAGGELHAVYRIFLSQGQGRQPVAARGMASVEPCCLVPSHIALSDKLHQIRHAIFAAGYGSAPAGF